ncbi:unnamed protein product, partial [Prorocentrum cordatum]
ASGPRQAHPPRQRSGRQCPPSCSLRLSPTACCGSATPSTVVPGTPCRFSPTSLVGQPPLETDRGAAFFAEQCSSARARPDATPSSSSSSREAEATRRPCRATRGWKKGSQIGHGSYGSVHLARDMQ